MIKLGSKFSIKPFYPTKVTSVFERDMGSNERREITHPQQLLTRKILPIDIFYKLFGKTHERRR